MGERLRHVGSVGSVVGPLESAGRTDVNRLPTKGTGGQGVR